MFERLKTKATELKRDIVALYFAARDPRTPWYAKAMVLCIVAYALSPIDLIPDPIPILGYIDDLLLLPLGIYVAIKLVPPEVLRDCRAKAEARNEKLPRNWHAAAAIIVLWLLAMILVAFVLVRFFSTNEAPDAKLGY